MNKVMLKVKGVLAFIEIARDLNKLDRVLDLGDALMESPEHAQQVVDGYRKTPEGVRAFAERPRLGASLDRAALSKLPEGTLGRTYADFMSRNGLDPTAVVLRNHPGDIGYVVDHLRETHDLWHVVTGFDADVPGELGLQAFYLAQFPNAFALLILLAGLSNCFLNKLKNREEILSKIARGWLMGRRARLFFGVDWKAWWAMPLSEVRARLDVQGEAVDAALNPFLSKEPLLRAAA